MSTSLAQYLNPNQNQQYPAQSPAGGAGGYYNTGNKSPNPTGGSQWANNMSLAGQGASAVAGMYFDYQKMQQAEKQFGMESAYNATNLYNTATAYNADQMNRIENGLALAGIRPGTPEYNDAIAGVEANYAQTSVGG